MVKRRIVTSKEKEDALIRAIHGGTKLSGSEGLKEVYKARKKLYELLQPVVEEIAGHYMGRGVSAKDLIKSGNVGIRKALLHYDISKKYKFSSYCTWWIRAEIHKLLGLPVDSRKPS